MVATYSRDDLRAGRADRIANLSLKMTRYGNRRLAALGACGSMPPSAKRCPPPRAA